MVAQIVKPVPVSDGSIPDTTFDYRGNAITRAVPLPCPGDEWFVPKFSHRARRGRLTPERSPEQLIQNIFRPKDIEALLGMQSRREYALSWTWQELETISDEVEPPHHIQLQSGYKVWMDHEFRIPQKVIPVENVVIEESVRQGLFEPSWGPYTNAHLFGPE